MEDTNNQIVENFPKEIYIRLGDVTDIKHTYRNSMAWI